MKTFTVFCLALVIALVSSCNIADAGGGGIDVGNDVTDAGDDVTDTGDDDAVSSDPPFVGSWIRENVYHAYSPVLHFNEDGTGVSYWDYAETNQDYSFTWEYVDDVLTIHNLDDFYTVTWDVENYTDSLVSFVEYDDDGWEDHWSLYKKGSNKTSYIFDNPAESCELNTEYTLNLQVGESILLAFPVSDGSEYSVFWDDAYSGSGSYSADVAMTAYNADQSWAYYVMQDSGYELDDIITFTAEGDTLYLIVYAYWAGGDVLLKVSEN